MSSPGTFSKFLRYGMTGGLAAVVDLGGFAVLLAAGSPVLLASVLSFLIATVVNYTLSARFAFGGVPISARSYLRFLAFAGLGLVVNVAVTVIVDAAGVPAVLAKLAGIGVAFVVNFALNLVFVFPRSR